MAQAPIESLEQLLRALGRERSLRGRLRVLGHSWTLLRSLSPSERERVALRLGSNWAWKRVEQAFLKDGKLSESEQLVGRAFRQLGGSDPGELRMLARMIKERDRSGAKDLLMMTLSEALEEEAEEETDPVETQGAEPRPAEPAPPPPAAADAPPPEPRAAGELVESAEQVLASVRARAVERPARPAPAPPEPVPRAEPRPAPAVEPEPAPPPAAAPPPREPAAPPASEPAPPPEPLSAGPLAAPPAASRLQALRALQRSPRPGEDLGRAGRAELIASLGGGWASRRALSRMIAARSLEDLDEALAQIRSLARPGQQAWCLADLLEHWELDASDVERILDAAPTHAARRRLYRRSHAA